MTRLQLPCSLFLCYILVVSIFQQEIGVDCFPLSSTVTRRESIQGGAALLLAGGSNMSSTSAPESNRNIRWGIVGLGDVCQKKSGPAFYKCRGSELVAVMRRTPGKANEFAAKVPGGKCTGYENLDDFLSHPELDAVYVSTRPGTHLEICEKVAKAGKACYVEKPVGRCREESEKIANLFADAGLPLYTAYISRAYDRTQAIRTLISNGAVGDEITNVSYKLIGSGGARDMDGELPWRLDAKDSGGGLIMDVGCHVLDRIDYLCGPLIDVKGSGTNKHQPNVPVEDFVQLTAKIGKCAWAAIPNKEGAYVTCSWDFASTEAPCDEFKIIGPKGSLKMAAMSPSAPIEVYDSYGKLLEKLNFEMPEHTAQALIQAVTDDLRGVGKQDFLSFGDNAIRTSEVLDTVLDSYYGGREIGYWTRTNWPGSPSGALV